MRLKIIILLLCLIIENSVFADSLMEPKELSAEESLREYGLVAGNFVAHSYTQNGLPVDKNGRRLPITEIELAPGVVPGYMDEGFIEPILDNKCMTLVCDLTHVETITIASYKFSSETFSFDITKLKHLKQISILECKSIPISFFEQLAKSSSIQYIEFDESVNAESIKICLSSMNLKRVEYPFNDDSIVYLSKQKNLIWLEVTSDCLTVEASKTIKELPNLRLLIVRGSGINDDFVKNLLSLNKMECLVIWRTSITDKSIDYIEQWGSLKEVFVPLTNDPESKISKEGYRRLALIKNKTIYYKECPLMIHGIDYDEE